MIVCHCTGISDADIHGAIDWMRAADPDLRQRRNPKRLARVDLVRVLQHRLVRLEDRHVRGHEAEHRGKHHHGDHQLAPPEAEVPQGLSDGPALGLGAPHPERGAVYNAYHLLDGGRIRASILQVLGLWKGQGGWREGVQA